MTIWDTSSLPVADQLPYWHEVVSQAFVALRSQPHENVQEFQARVESRPMHAVSRALIDSPAQLTQRGHREIKRDEGDFYFLNVQISGSCRVLQGDQSINAGPGDCVILDTAQPYTLDFSKPWSMLSYRLPGAEVERFVSTHQEAHGAVLRGSSGFGRLVAGMARSLWHVTGPQSTMRDLECGLVSTLGTALAASSAQPADRDAELRALALRYAQRRLEDPSLDATAVAAELGISVRRLHAAFAAEQRPFAATVRTMRLEQSARVLQDPDMRAPITEIGARHGFPDPASFSRAFRRAYGVSPREWRAQALGVSASE